MTMPNRGKLVICAIVALGLAAAAFSVWFHYQGAHRSGDFWGTATAQLIVEAPEVRALRLDAAPQPQFDEEGMQLDPPDEPAVEFRNGFWTVLSDHDASKARGLVNVRRALVQDASFDWRGRPNDPNWLYGLEFNDGRLWATVLFDFDSCQVALSGARKTAMLDPAASDAWRKFFDEQFAAQESASPEPSEPAERADRPAVDKPSDDEAAEDKAPDDKPAETP